MIEFTYMVAFALIGIGALGGVLVAVWPKHKQVDEHATARFI